MRAGQVCRALAQGWGAQIHVLSVVELFFPLDTSASHIPNAPSADPLPCVLSPFLAVETSLFPRYILAGTKLSAMLQPGPAVIPPSARLLDRPLHVPSSLAMSSPPFFREASAYTFDRQLLFSERALCPLFPPVQPKSSWKRCHSSPMPEEILLRQSLATSSPCTFHSQSCLPPKQLQTFLPSLAEEPSGGETAIPGETQPLRGRRQVWVALMEPPRAFQLCLSAEVVLVQVQGKGEGWPTCTPC